MSKLLRSMSGMLTAINTAIARPRVTGSLYTSAKSPPTTAIALEALIPQSRRKIRKDGQFGATAQAKVKIVKKTKLDIMMSRLPNDSLSGPKNNGPRT